MRTPIVPLVVVLLGASLAARPALADKAADRAAAKAAAKAAAAEQRAAQAASDATLKQATRLVHDGDYAGALALLDAALAATPADLQLLKLRAATLLETRDFEGALGAYEAFLAAGARGANKRAAEKIVKNLQAIKTTFVHVKLNAGPASVYLESRTLGVFCVAEPECRRGLLPGAYRVIIEKDGYARLQERFVVKAGQTAELERALVENPSEVAITATPAGAQLRLDDKDLGVAPQSLVVPPGDHTLEVRLDGHAADQRRFAAHEGKKVELAVALLPIVPVSVPVEGATLLVDDQPARREAGGIVLPDQAGAHVLVVRAKTYRDARIDIPGERPEGYEIDVVLKRAPGHLTFAGVPHGATVIVDGKLRGEAPLAAPVELETGEHAVEIQARGYVTYRGQARIEPEVTSSLVVTRWQSTSKKKTWIAAGAAGVGLVGGVLFGALALGTESDYRDRAGLPDVSPSDPTLASIQDDGDRYALFSDLGFGLAAVGAGLAAYWYVTEGKGESEGRFEPMVGPGTVGLSATTRF